MVFRLMDTEVVINEVKKRECLWNPHSVYYKNKLDKYRAWEEISEIVVPKYHKCTEDEKSQICEYYSLKYLHYLLVSVITI